MMIVDDDDCVYLIPPNQQDWHFTLRKSTSSDDVWHVAGVREFEEVNMTYVRCNATWQRNE